MARTRHTDSPKVIAGRAERRTGIARPRVVERRPRRGDVHPIPKRLVEAFLLVVPNEYVHGLRRVELRARQDAVGRPYAYYSRREKIVVIHSVPLEWSFASLGRSEARSLLRGGAEVEVRDDSVVVRWDDVEKLGFWFAFDVLFHELGHHFIHQYRRRKDGSASRNDHELRADTKALRIRRAFVRRAAEVRRSMR